MSRNMDEEDSMLFSLLFTWWWWILKWEGKNMNFWWIDMQSMLPKHVWESSIYHEVFFWVVMTWLYLWITNWVWDHNRLSFRKYDLAKLQHDRHKMQKYYYSFWSFKRVANMHQKKEEIKETTSNLFFLFGCFAFLCCLHD